MKTLSQICFLIFVVSFAVFIVNLVKLIIYAIKKKPSDFVDKAMKKSLIIFVSALFVGVIFSDSEEPSVDEQKQIFIPTKQEIIENSIEVSYKDLLRYPDDYVGEYMTVEIVVNQKLTPRLSHNTYYFGFAEVSNLIAFGDKYCFFDKRDGDITKILENDRVKIYGEFVGLDNFIKTITYTDEEVPIINAYYVDIIG